VAVKLEPEGADSSENEALESDLIWHFYSIADCTSTNDHAP
jgi:hypothetical protein